MPTPTFTTSKPVTTHVHEVITNRKLDYIDIITILLPVVIPIITFRLGYILNSREEKRKEKERLNEVKIYFLTLTKFLAEFVDAQSKVIQDATAIVQLMTDTNVSAGVYPELNTKRIRAIPDLDIYKIFVADKKKTIEHSTGLLNKLSSALDSIDNIRIRLEQNNAELVKEVLLYIERFNIAYNALADENAQLVKKGVFNTIIKESETFELHKIYAQCIRELAAEIKNGNIEGGNLTKRYEVFIKPLFERTRAIREIESTQSMLTNISILNQDYKNFISAKANATDIFSSLAINCRNVSAEIRLIYSNFTE